LRGTFQHTAHIDDFQNRAEHFLDAFHHFVFATTCPTQSQNRETFVKKPPPEASNQRSIFQKGRPPLTTVGVQFAQGLNHAGTVVLADVARGGD
jgi:hypothetical protein